MTALDSRMISIICDSDPENEDENQALKKESHLPAAPQTGPKGVLADYRRYSAILEQEKELNKLAQIAEHKKSSFTADPNKFPDKSEDDDFEDDDFLKKYHEKRLLLLAKEIESESKNTTKFSKLFDLTGEELLKKLENSHKGEILVVHLYDPKVQACVKMNECFEYLAKQYPYAQFAKVLAKEAGLSLNFQRRALPTIQVYKDGNLIGNFLDMQDKLDIEFHPSDVENFLIDSNMFADFQT